MEPRAHRPPKMTKGRENVASEAKSEGLVFHPMDQFIVKPFFGEGPIEFYTFTNVAFWMVAAVVAVIAIMVLGTSRRAVVPSRSQSVAELAYGFVYKMVEDVTGKDAVGFFPYIMTLFHVHCNGKLLGSDPNIVHNNIALCGHSDPSDVRVPNRDNRWFCEKWRWVLGAFLGVVCPPTTAPDPSGDRTYLIFRASCEPLYSFGGQRYGGPRGYQSVRRLCRDRDNRTCISHRNRCDVRT